MNLDSIIFRQDTLAYLASKGFAECKDDCIRTGDLTVVGGPTEQLITLNNDRAKLSFVEKSDLHSKMYATLKISNNLSVSFFSDFALNNISAKFDDRGVLCWFKYNRREKLSVNFFRQTQLGQFFHRPIVEGPAYLSYYIDAEICHLNDFVYKRNGKEVKKRGYGFGRPSKQIRKPTLDSAIDLCLSALSSEKFEIQNFISYLGI